MTALLRAEGLAKSFGMTDALHNASLQVTAGEIVAVMGRSGSGKSTLLHCAAGIIKPDAGSVTYNGHELTTMPDGKLSALRRSQFGFVFQFGQLVPELTCLENAALPLRLNGARRKPAEANATEYLERLEIGEIANKRPGEVSGGQGQRVSVVRALIARPTIVFADEPTGALDSLNGEKVMRLLTDTARLHAMAIVVVTHDPRVAAYSDREVTLRDGRTPELAPVR